MQRSGEYGVWDEVVHVVVAIPVSTKDTQSGMMALLYLL